VEDSLQFELMLGRFRRLMSEVRSGVVRRNNFEPWEIDILLDLSNCHLTRRRMPRVLERYRIAVERQLEMGCGPPIKPSQFLASRAGGNIDQQRLAGRDKIT
jgi:hypothetical protein